MFKDQIPHMPRPCDEAWPSAKPWLANGTPLVPVPPGLTEGWGLSFSISHQASNTGRPAGTGSWEGLANLYWFADRKTGIAGVIASQILPYGGKFRTYHLAKPRLNVASDRIEQIWKLFNSRRPLRLKFTKPLQRRCESKE